MTSSTISSDALALLQLPAYDGLSRAQQRGAECVCCAIVLTPATAISLGSRTFSGPYEWYPRGCGPCVEVEASRALDDHTGCCEQCGDDAGLCDIGVELRRLGREGRRP